jgi:hypothetical protein
LKSGTESDESATSYILLLSPKEAELQKKRREEAVRFFEEELAIPPDPTRPRPGGALISLRFKRYLKVIKNSKIWIDRRKSVDTRLCFKMQSMG